MKMAAALATEDLLSFKSLLFKGRTLFLGQTAAPPRLICLVEAAKGPD